MERQVGLKSLNEPIDTSTSQGRLIFNIYPSVGLNNMMLQYQILDVFLYMDEILLDQKTLDLDRLTQKMTYLIQYHFLVQKKKTP